ncbi:MAG: glycosyltransferase [Bacteroidales bacterium]|nr:glycosyltransferase [Bacteroidales bacterium]
MKKAEYPNLIILGSYLNKSDGGGITLFNLLEGWPKDKLSVVNLHIEKEGLEICSRYYRIGYDETKRPWPLNIFQPKYQSGEVELSPQKKIDDFRQYTPRKSRYNRFLKQGIEYLVRAAGIYHFLFPLKLSNKLLDWLDKNSPDIIYTQLLNPWLVPFVKELVRQRDIPLVIHFMDDWPKVANEPGLSHLYWNHKLKRDLRHILSQSKLLMSICETMSEEYKERYGHEFIPFHNYVDLDFWKQGQKTSWTFSDNFKILYAGRIGPGTSESLFTVMKAVEDIGEKGIRVEMQIQCKKIPQKFEEFISQAKHIVRNDFAEYNDLPFLFSAADLLVLPMDFDKKNLDYIHLSMPTKAPEYMICGTPILVFAHQSTALYQYASRYHWAFTVNENSIPALSTRLKEIIENQELREQYSKNAIHLAEHKHEKTQVKGRFQDALIQLKK